MKAKFKRGDKVSLEYNGKSYIGEIYIVDITPKGYRYDIMCSKPKKVLIKHVYEDDPNLRSC